LLGGDILDVADGGRSDGEANVGAGPRLGGLFLCPRWLCVRICKLFVMPICGDGFRSLLCLHLCNRDFGRLLALIYRFGVLFWNMLLARGRRELAGRIIVQLAFVEFSQQLAYLLGTDFALGNIGWGKVRGRPRPSRSELLPI